MVDFSLFGQKATLLDEYKGSDGKIRVVILTRGLTKTGSISRAKTEATQIIPFRDQIVETVEMEKDLSVNKRYRITIKHNEDEYY